MDRKGLRAGRHRDTTSIFSGVYDKLISKNKEFVRKLRENENLLMRIKISFLPLLPLINLNSLKSFAYIH